MKGTGTVTSLWWTKATPGNPRRKKAGHEAGMQWQARVPGAPKPTERFERESDAWAWVRREEGLLREARLSGRVIDDRTLTEYSEYWLGAQIQFADRTKVAVRSRWQRHILPELGALKMVAISRVEVQQAVVKWQESLSPSTIKVTFSYLKSAMRNAVIDKVIPDDPCFKIKLPEATGAPRVPLSDEQVHEIAERMPPRLYAMAILAAQTGMRIGELRGLCVQQIAFDQDGAIITVDRQLKDRTGGVATWSLPKGRRKNIINNNARTITIDQDTAQVLRNHMVEYPPHRNGLVFTSLRRTPLGRNTPVRVWLKATKDMPEDEGGDLTGWHAFRHYHASVLIGDGGSVPSIQRRLGHSAASITLNTYSHWWPIDDEQSRRSINRLWKTRPARGEIAS